MDVFQSLESNVRFYSRNYPVVFNKAHGCILEDENGAKYIDFLSGAGALNYGHNHPQIKKAVIKYLEEDGISHSLDMATVAKKELIHTLNEVILKPRGMDYKLQFCGPTGTNAVEAALKLARKVIKRQAIISFTNAFHGVSLGSLALSGSKSKRKAAGVSLDNAIFMPYDNYFGTDFDTIQYIDKCLSDSGSGIDIPAAFIVETIQAEGGINSSSIEWLNKLQKLARKYDSLLIIDDIQVGCGRTGKFFSFEDCNISPDLICLSKSFSAYGLPLAVVLIKPEHDLWDPGEHNGTFRGNNLAFISAKEGLNFWQDPKFISSITEKIALLEELLLKIIKDSSHSIKLKGRGMIRGLEFEDYVLAKKIADLCFANGLIIETSGSKDQVIKFLPPINIDNEHLKRGVEILRKSIESF